jgi:hypothetical protein
MSLRRAPVGDVKPSLAADAAALSNSLAANTAAIARCGRVNQGVASGHVLEEKRKVL